MATVALVTVGVAGRVYSGMEIARRLGKAGHTVVFASTNTAVAGRVTGAGYDFFQLDDGVPAALRERRRALPPGRRSARARRRIEADIARARGRAALAGFGIDELLRHYRPGLVLLESELHDSILYLLGHAPATPIALLEYHVSVRRVAGVPPLSSTYIPAGALERANSALLWRKMRIRRRLRQLWMRYRERGWDRRSVWRRLAAEGGLSLRAIASEAEWPILHYTTLPRLQLCAPEFDFPHARMDDAIAVGPVVQARREPPDTDADAVACRSLLTRLAGSARPLVVCATGSILTLPRFVRTAIAAADGADFDLIVAAGRRLDPASLGDLPANVYAFRRVPQLEVLERAALFICHCGIASVHEAVLAGVPILACSGGVMDENGNAARVEFHGLGLRGSMTSDAPAGLRRKIDRLLSEPAFARNVRSMRDTMLRYTHEDRLCAEIERLLSLGARSAT